MSHIGHYLSCKSHLFMSTFMSKNFSRDCYFCHLSACRITQAVHAVLLTASVYSCIPRLLKQQFLPQTWNITVSPTLDMISVLWLQIHLIDLPIILAATRRGNFYVFFKFPFSPSYMKHSVS